MDADVVRVERWPTEIPLLVLVILASIGVWTALAVSLIGIFYAVMLGLFFFVAHLALVFHVRGSGVRIGPEQFPELHERIGELARRAGLAPAPAAYVMQAGGALNAFATKLFRSRLIVLYSDLLDACGDDAAARDMIVGHELGHIRAGHLSWMWLIVPGMFVPFLGAAYSRARERTCDRYGAALCGNTRGAVQGLTILAAGGRRAGSVNPGAFARQAKDLDTGWMTVARWLSTYPPLCERIARIDGSLAASTSQRGPLRALGILALAALVPLGLGAYAATRVAPWFATMVAQGQREAASRQAEAESGERETRERIRQDFGTLANAAFASWRETGTLPSDASALYAECGRIYFNEPTPLEPADGSRYRYELEGETFILRSNGKDGIEGTHDDIITRFATHDPAERSAQPASSRPG